MRLTSLVIVEYIYGIPPHICLLLPYFQITQLCIPKVNRFHICIAFVS